jgi:hypothetical protein
MKGYTGGNTERKEGKGETDGRNGTEVQSGRKEGNTGEEEEGRTRKVDRERKTARSYPEEDT